MQIKKTKNDIHSFCVNDFQKIYTTTTKEIMLDNEVIFRSEDGFQEIYCANSAAITNTINGIGIEIDLLSKEIKTLHDESLRYIDENFKITFENGKTKIYSKDNRLTAIKPLRIFKFILHKYTKCFVYYEGSYFDTSNHKINYSSLLDDKIFFSFPLASLGTFMDGVEETPYQVMEFSGIYQNILVCTLNSGGILLLDLQSGQMLEHFREVGIRTGVYQESDGSSRFLGLKHTTFIEIDVVERKVIRRINLESLFKELMNIPNETPCWFTAGTSIYKNGLFYFYGDRNVLVIFDPKSEKIIDHYNFKFEKTATQLKGGNGNLQVLNNEIYCLDTSGTLHIIEK